MNSMFMAGPYISHMAPSPATPALASNGIGWTAKEAKARGAGQRAAHVALV